MRGAMTGETINGVRFLDSGLFDLVGCFLFLWRSEVVGEGTAKSDTY